MRSLWYISFVAAILGLASAIALAVMGKHSSYIATIGWPLVAMAWMFTARSAERQAGTW